MSLNLFGFFGFHEAVSDILLPERKSSLIYTAEMVTAIILSLRLVKETAPTSKLRAFFVANSFVFFVCF